MGIGGSILLIVLGAILAFAVNYQVGWLDINVVGWVLMIGGAVGLILTTVYWQSRRRTVIAPPVEETRAVVEDGRVVDEYRDVPPSRRV